MRSYAKKDVEHLHLPQVHRQCDTHNTIHALKPSFLFENPRRAGSPKCSAPFGDPAHGIFESIESSSRKGKTLKKNRSEKVSEKTPEETISIFEVPPSLGERIAPVSSKLGGSLQQALIVRQRNG